MLSDLSSSANAPAFSGRVQGAARSSALAATAQRPQCDPRGFLPPGRGLNRNPARDLRLVSGRDSGQPRRVSPGSARRPSLIDASVKTQTKTQRPTGARAPYDRGSRAFRQRGTDRGRGTGPGVDLGEVQSRSTRPLALRFMSPLALSIKSPTELRLRPVPQVSAADLSAARGRGRGFARQGLPSGPPQQPQRLQVRAFCSVGAPGFEPGTSCRPDICSRWAPSGVEWCEVADVQGFPSCQRLRTRFAPRPGFRTFGRGIGALVSDRVNAAQPAGALA
jgi:hypothetical protein